MLSQGDAIDDDHLHNSLTTIDHCNLARVYSSSSSNTSCNNHSPFSNAVRTMEEVWKDINLSVTNHPDASVKAGYRGFILQDFLAKPFSSNDVTPTAVSSPVYGSPSPPPPPPPPQQPMLLNLNSGPDQMNFLTTEDQTNRMRMFPATGGDRRHKRMIKNRESAARSRARKQAYTNELENEVERLKKENAMLRQQHEQLQEAASAQVTKKRGLHRTSTAPF